VKFEDLGRTWQQREAGAPLPTEPDRQLAAVRESARALERTVRRRDLLETLVALLLLPVFAYFAVRSGNPISRLGAAIIAVSCVAIPLILRRARRRAPDLGLPVGDFLRLELAFVARQRRLLLTVPLWYLTPLGLGAVLFFAGASPSHWLTAAYAAGVVIFSAVVWWLNRRAVTVELEPRERELHLWIQLGDASEPSEESRNGDA
jgi:hypothetical protein